MLFLAYKTANNFFQKVFQCTNPTLTQNPSFFFLKEIFENEELESDREIVQEVTFKQSPH